MKKFEILAMAEAWSTIAAQRGAEVLAAETREASARAEAAVRGDRVYRHYGVAARGEARDARRQASAWAQKARRAFKGIKQTRPLRRRLTNLG